MSFNPLPPVKEGVTMHRVADRAGVHRFNPLPPVKEGVTLDSLPIYAMAMVSILSLRLRRE